MKHPKVDNCAVVPVDDPSTFQAPVAYIVPKKDFKKDKNIKMELISYGKEHMLAGYRPIQYIFVEKFPLTKVGKVNYTELEKMAKKIVRNEQV